LPSFLPSSVHVAFFTVVYDPLNECDPPNAGILTVETTVLQLIHLPTFFPSSVHVGSFSTEYEPLKLCPVAGIDCEVFAEHLEHVPIFPPLVVHVAACTTVHEP